MNQRKFFLLGGLALLVILSFSLISCGKGNDEMSSLLSSADVSLFINKTYVDYEKGDSGAEASNLEATIKGYGMTVRTFTGITAGDFSNNGALARKALVIPELESGPLNAHLSADARTAIAKYVNDGGNLIVFCPSYSELIDLLNQSFGWSLATSGTSVTSLNLGVDAVGTAFAGGPATLPSNDATNAVFGLSLPIGAKAIYVDSVTGDAGLVVIPYGSGNVIIMGWDWYDAAPVGSQDGGWLTVLQTALNL